MEKFMLWFQFAMNILPLVLQGIQAVEHAVGPGNGAAKKQILIDAVKVATPPDIDTDSAVAITRALVDSSVAALNQAGKLPPGVVK